VGFQRTLGPGLTNLNLETTVYRECIAMETWSFRLVYFILFALALTATSKLWGQQQATVRGIITGLSGSVIPGATVREARSQAQFNR
jgi:hypothetical protein